ncbi:hypothetical protein F0562_022456 [Nyssa sinensis]|uniref:F-box domain-containing protein n=1 Tax=Nyssa sinensis TaxID=561372 RepID=A0A5J5BPF0_9ASTE|nr:hypothetical protein F0562_022456 [Nyssa sinensis]
MTNSEEVETEIEEESHFNRLPDEVVALIFNKLLNLKCLCWCSLVSKRFANIIPHVIAVSFTVPRRKPTSSIDRHHQLDSIPNNNDNLSKKLWRFLLNDVVARPFRFIRQIVGPKPMPSSISAFYGDSFRSAVYFLSKFKEVRSLQIELPSSCHVSDVGGSSGGGESLFKWRAKFRTKLETFAFLSPTSLCTMERFTGANGGEEESELTSDLLKYRVHLAFQCLKDALVRHRMLLFLIEQHPMLESVAITDSKKLGKLSVRNEQLVELRNWIHLSSATLGTQLKSIEIPVTARQWYVPVLQLPLSKKVMQGATLVLMGLVDRRDSGGSSAGGCDGDGDGDVVAIAGCKGGGHATFGRSVCDGNAKSMLYSFCQAQERGSGQNVGRDVLDSVSYLEALVGRNGEYATVPKVASEMPSCVWSGA